MKALVRFVIVVVLIYIPLFLYERYAFVLDNDNFTNNFQIESMLRFEMPEFFGMLFMFSYLKIIFEYYGLVKDVNDNSYNCYQNS